MKISYNQLKSFIHLNETPEEIEQLLTGCGLEVESMEAFETIKGGLKGVVAGKVLTCIQHPNADRLRVTTVDLGSGDPVQIVCGAPNVAEGQTVVVATVGTTLYTKDGKALTIEKSKIRGEVSQGMICAEDELGLGESHDGIIVLPNEIKIGTPAAQIFEINSDTIFEIGLTANRGDAASHLGVARDLSTLLNRDLIITFPELKLIDTTPIKINVENIEDCIRYSGIYIEGVEVKESPDWLKYFLKSIGLNPINNIVDITNYILHKYGQPIHAFDANDIKGNEIVVKTAIPGTKFTTLDQAERTLQGSELMIYNAAEPMAIGGVFGGLHSGVKSDTKNIFIESACFHPASVRKTAKLHGISTDSSFRFERGTDPEFVVDGLKNTAALVLELAGGRIASNILDIYPNKVIPIQIEYSLIKMNKLIGQQIPKEKVLNILSRLDIKILSDKGDILLLEVPPRKSDVTRDADVTEEILRIFGLNNIHFPEQMLSSQSSSLDNAIYNFRNKIADFLCANGFNEMMNNSLTSLKKVHQPDAAVELLNPLSNELDTMRQSLIHGALQSLAYNKNRQQHDIKLFEFGKVYFKKSAEKYKEQFKLSLIVSGNREPESFEGKPRVAGFYYIKSAIEEILKLSSISTNDFYTIDHPYLEECFVYKFKQKDIVQFGYINNEVGELYDLSNNVLYAEFDWETIANFAIQSEIKYLPIPKFPVMRRDLSMLLDESITFRQISELIHQTERKLLTDVGIFDIYRGEKIGEGKKSYAIFMKFNDAEKTLTDAEIEKSMGRICQRLEKELQVIFR